MTSETKFNACIFLCTHLFFVSVTAFIHVHKQRLVLTIKYRVDQLYLLYTVIPINKLYLGNILTQWSSLSSEFLLELEYVKAALQQFGLLNAPRLITDIYCFLHCYVSHQENANEMNPWICSNRLNHETRTNTSSSCAMTMKTRCLVLHL